MNAIMMMIKRAHTRAKFHPFILLLFLRSHKTIQQQQQSWRRQAMVEWYSCGNPMRMGTFNASRIFKVISVVVFLVAKSMTRPQVAPCDEWIKIKNEKKETNPHATDQCLKKSPCKAQFSVYLFLLLVDLLAN
jgi:hypothetical protein